MFRFFLNFLLIPALIWPLANGSDFSREAECYFINPVVTGKGIVCTDNYYSSIYLLNDNPEILVSAPGCGRYLDFDLNNNLIGFKLIDSAGLQTPAVYDLNHYRIKRLSEAVTQSGQVRFTGSGQVLFTIRDTLYVLADNYEKLYPLGYYVNNFAVDQSGEWLAYNDDDDQIWILNLNSGEKKPVTEHRNGGFCNPQWSWNSQRLAYSSLTGEIWIYDLADQANYRLGQGQHFCWDSTGDHLVYSVQEYEDMKLVNSDLFISDYQGQEKIKLTRTPDNLEISPCFISEDQIIFADQGGPRVVRARINDNSLIIEREWKFDYQLVPVNYYSPVDDFYPRDSFDVPYYHQVYDVPDWFNGHWACAPTTAIMVIDYYQKLPSWNCWCSNPYGHTSDMGRYVCERYHYFLSDYHWEALDPSNNPAQGGYGFMWHDSYSPYSRMADYISQHQINSNLTDYPTFSQVINEIDSGFPYPVCVGLTGSGHLILTLGQVSTWHTLIFNDPYGNKNTSGYPSYDGKYARYDWPGYNNGYQNLNQVYWAVTARANMPSPADSIVDDLQYDGFNLFNDPPARMSFWRDGIDGYNGHYWWTYTTAAQGEDTCWATWTPHLSTDGFYHLYAWIPAENADAQQAVYQIHHAQGVDSVIVDQSLYSNQWYLLGSYWFDNTGGFVYLGDATGYQGRKIAFDAIRWSYQYSGQTETSSQNCWADQFNWELTKGVLNINFHLDINRTIQLNLYDLSGRIIREQNYCLIPGDHQVNINLNSHPSGVYFLMLGEEGSLITVKLNLLH